MSKVTIAGDVNGSGVFTLAAPNGNTNRTLVLPDETGTMALQGGAGVGKVLQVVSGTNTVLQTVATTAWADTNLSITITPSSTASKIYLQFNYQEVHIGTATSGVSFRFMRNGVALFTPPTGYSNWAASQLHLSIGDIAMDSPSAIGAITYTVQVRGHTTDVVYINFGGNFKDTFIAMEIGA
jgi:hypothetical protein